MRNCGMASASPLAKGYRKAASQFLFNINRIEEKYSRLQTKRSPVIDIRTMKLVVDEEDAMADPEGFKSSVERANRFFTKHEFGEACISTPVVELNKEEDRQKVQRLNQAFEKKLARNDISLAVPKKKVIEFFKTVEVGNVNRKRGIRATLQDNGQPARLEFMEEKQFVNYKRHRSGAITEQRTNVRKKMTIVPPEISDSFKSEDNCTAKKRFGMLIDDSKTIRSGVPSMDGFDRGLALKNGNDSNEMQKLLSKVSFKLPVVQRLPKFVLTSSNWNRTGAYNVSSKPVEMKAIEPPKKRKEVRNTPDSAKSSNSVKRVKPADMKATEPPKRRKESTRSSADSTKSGSCVEAVSLNKDASSCFVRQNVSEDVWVEAWIHDQRSRIANGDFEDVDSFPKSLRRAVSQAQNRNERLKRGYYVPE